MSEWSDEAMGAWASYLDDVRAALEEAGAGDAETVVRDLEDHATEAFSGVREPVSEGRINALVARLGTPHEIAAAAADAGLRPGDATIEPDARLRWIFTYGSLAALAAGVLWPAGAPGAVVLAYVLARVGAAGTGAAHGADRRLLFPALLVGSAVLVLLITAWPIALVLPAAARGGPVEAFVRQEDGAGYGSIIYWSAIWSVGALATGLWCLTLRSVLSRAPHLLGRVLFPFGSSARAVYRARRALLAAGSVLAAAGSGVLLILLTR